MLRGRILDVLCGAVASLLASAIVAVSAMEEIPPERAERHRQAIALGDHAVFVDRPQPPPQPLVPIIFVEPTRAELEALARDEYRRAGMAAHAAWLLAQLEAESAFDPMAESPVGALGLAQFMPPTAAEEFPLTDPPCADVDRTDPVCSARAQARYMRRVAQWVDDRGDLHLAAAGYNAGAGHIAKQQRACAAAMGCDPGRWFGNVEKFCMRPEWACRESRTYLQRIAEHSRRYEDRT